MKLCHPFLGFTVSVAAAASACGSKGDKDQSAAGTGTGSTAGAVPSQPATPPPTTPPSPPPDPYASGFCEYTIDGGAPNKGGGGLMNVQSIHWLAADYKGRGLASPLLINCGSGKQVNIMSATEGIERGAKKFVIDRSGKPGTFSVLGPDFMGGDGELDVTAWDQAHVAGSFSFTAGGKRYQGTFDLKCPNAGGGGCS